MSFLDTDLPPAPRDDLPPAAVLALLAGVLLLWGFTVTAGHTWGGDFSQYIMHARNLVEGRAYTDTGYIHTAFAFVGPVAYPPVFPAWLAPVYALYGLDWVALKMVGVASFVLALLCLFLIVRGRIGRWHQLVLFAVLACNPFVWTLKDKIVSDLPFVFLFLLTLWFLKQRYVRQQDGYHDRAQGRWHMALWLGVLLYLVYGTREIGLVFVPAIIVFELYHFRRLSLISLLAMAVFAALAWWQSGFTRAPLDAAMQQNLAALAAAQGMQGMAASHIDLIHFNVFDILKQAVRYVSSLQDFWPDSETPWVSLASLLAFALTMLFAILGYLRAVLRDFGIMEIVLAGYLLVLFLFGGFQGLRYLIPVMPLILYYAFRTHYTMLFGPLRRVMLILGLTFAGSTALVYAASPVYSQTPEQGITSPEAKALLQFVKQSTPQDARFVFNKPRVLSLLTGRAASAWPARGDDDFLLAYMRAIDAGYLVLSDINWQGAALPLGERRTPSGPFELIFSNAMFRVYKLRQAAGNEANLYYSPDWDTARSSKRQA